ncbi:hypothetical protein [Methylocystis sp. ATCC 49242]|uniref:hypothetical protein n=1 Tax=Methylocystis sp. ATCC 49242 TaxID=622637 RepID=UPI0011857FC0|nr:hypothetical protein [Methylocystis sp. ATCC 49242]
MKGEIAYDDRLPATRVGKLGLTTVLILVIVIPVIPVLLFITARGDGHECGPAAGKPTAASRRSASVNRWT